MGLGIDPDDIEDGDRSSRRTAVLASLVSDAMAHRKTEIVWTPQPSAS